MEADLHAKPLDLRAIPTVVLGIAMLKLLIPTDEPAIPTVEPAIRMVELVIPMVELVKAINSRRLAGRPAGQRGTLTGDRRPGENCARKWSVKGSQMSK